MRSPSVFLLLLAATLLGSPTGADASSAHGPSGDAARAPVGPQGGPQAAAEPGAEPAAESGADSLRAFLLTFGAGAAVWERFGHNALWIHDPEAGTDVAYHYGLFDMSEEGFMVEFLQGRMLYSMGTAPAEWLVEAYRRAGRDATVQELRLTTDQVRELQSFLEWNMRPENRLYRYDYFRDNCSTRIRDALDRVLEGRLQEELGSLPSELTYRGQAVALTAEDELLTTSMDLGLGPLADQSITRWDLAYIPMRLRDDVRDLAIERNGRMVPLLEGERELPAIGPSDELVGEPPSETSPGRRALWHLVVGMLAGALLAGSGWLAGRSSTGGGADRAGRAARWTLAVLGALWSLLSGVLGLVLLALWLLTDHEFAWRNENLLQANPLALGLVVLVPLAVVAGRRVPGARTLALALLGLSVLGLLIHPLPLTPQENLSIIALMLPIHLGLVLALARAPARAPESAAVRPPRGSDGTLP